MGRPRLTLDPDNTAIWVSGREDLDMMIRREENTHMQKVEEIKARIERYHYKTVGKKQYLYLWVDGKHTYVGKKDPRPALGIECEGRAKRWASRRKQMQFCVIKEIDGHLIVDIKGYKKWLYPKVPPNVIRISGILEMERDPPEIKKIKK